mgnify:FL=1
MSQREREEKRRQVALEQHRRHIEEQRKLQMRPIARMVRALFRRPELWAK